MESVTPLAPHAVTSTKPPVAESRKTATTGHHNNYSPSAAPTSPLKPAPPTELPTSPSSRIKSSAPQPPSPRPAAKKARLVKRPARPPLTKKQLVILKQLLREEAVARLELESQEASDFISLGVSMQQSMLKLVNAHVQSGGGILATLQTDNELQRQANDEVRASNTAILQTVSVTSTVLKAFVDYHSSAEKEYTRRLEIENAVLKRQLDAKDVEIARQFAEIDGLRDSLSRLIIRTDVENETFRRDVRAQIDKNAVNVDHMKKELQQRIDDTVLAIHKPLFQSSVKGLKALVEEEQFKVQQSADELRFLVDQIGAENRFMPRQIMPKQQLLLDDRPAEVPPQALSKDQVAEYVSSASMHTNFPRYYREQLGKCRKDALLIILDTISFEPRVVTAVGHALASMAFERLAEEQDGEDEGAYTEEEEEDSPGTNVTRQEVTQNPQ